MKALTICQPYAHLICLPDDDERAKRIENRTWHCSHTGPLLIHAGKNRDWLTLSDDKLIDVCYGIPVSEMAFGAIVGVCDMRGCVKIEHLSDPHTGRFAGIVVDAWVKRKWPWIDQHQHAEGPFGFVLAECRRFDEPIPYRGAQGLFDVPDSAVRRHFWPDAPNVE